MSLPAQPCRLNRGMLPLQWQAGRASKACTAAVGLGVGLHPPSQAKPSQAESSQAEPIGLYWFFYGLVSIAKLSQGQLLGGNPLETQAVPPGFRLQLHAPQWPADLASAPNRWC